MTFFHFVNFFYLFRQDFCPKELFTQQLLQFEDDLNRIWHGSVISDILELSGFQKHSTCWVLLLKVILLSKSSRISFVGLATAVGIGNAYKAMLGFSSEQEDCLKEPRRLWNRSCKVFPRWKSRGNNLQFKVGLRIAWKQWGQAGLQQPARLRLGGGKRKAV